MKQLTFFDSTTIDKTDKKEEEKVNNKILWKNYYNMAAKLDSLKPAAIFNGILSEIKFVLPQFFNNNTPLLMVIGNKYYKCYSSTAAAKSIERAQEVTGSQVLEELGKMREVWVSSEWNRYTRRKEDVIRQLHGFKNIEGHAHILEELISNVNYIMGDSLRKIFMTDINGLCSLCDVPGDRIRQAMTLLGMSMLVLRPSNIGQIDGYENLMKGVISTIIMPTPDEDTSKNILECVIQSTPQIIIEFNEICGVCNFMPSKNGWGYLTPIVNPKQFDKYGVGNDIGGLGQRIIELLRSNVEFQALAKKAVSLSSALPLFPVKGTVKDDDGNEYVDYVVPEINDSQLTEFCTCVIQMLDNLCTIDGYGPALYGVADYEAQRRLFNDAHILFQNSEVVKNVNSISGNKTITLAMKAQQRINDANSPIANTFLQRYYQQKQQIKIGIAKSRMDDK